MDGGVVIKRTKGLSPAPAPELEIAEPSISIPTPEPGEPNPARDAYVLEHAPQVLSALIIRRSGTDAEQLVDKAVRAAAAIYDHVRRTSC